jgi:hypothetical protein
MLVQWVEIARAISTIVLCLVAGAAGACGLIGVMLVMAGGLPPAALTGFVPLLGPAGWLVVAGART